MAKSKIKHINLWGSSSAAPAAPSRAAKKSKARKRRAPRGGSGTKVAGGTRSRR
tara:strand:- start:4518 stop:4679 length:162 start_codon:yes stop_codon:yes gene_type:complete